MGVFLKLSYGDCVVAEVCEVKGPVAGTTHQRTGRSYQTGRVAQRQRLTGIFLTIIFSRPEMAGQESRQF